MAKATSTDTTDTPKVSRPRKSPAERASADLEKAQKALDKANQRATKAQADLDKAQQEQEQAEKYLEYVRRNPALPAEDAPASSDVSPDQQEIPEA